MRPSVLFELVPWMMLSTAVRVLSVHGGIATVVVMQLSDLFMFIAFVIAARRMIEWTGGVTTLGQLTLWQRVSLGRRILARVIAVMLVGVALGWLVGGVWYAWQMGYGFDGIAYDQHKAGFVWSGFLAAFTLVMVLRVEHHQDWSILGTMRELWERGLYISAAIVAIAVVDLGLSFVQGQARLIVHAFWISDAASSLLRALVYFGFVFAFASLRLWITLAILIVALRESHRRGRAASGAASG